MRYTDNVKVTVEWGSEPDEVFDLTIPAHNFAKGQGGFRFAEKLAMGTERYTTTIQFIDQHKDAKLVAAAEAVAEAKELKAERIRTDRILATLDKVGLLRRPEESE